jgi:hypothetical protein
MRMGTLRTGSAGCSLPRKGAVLATADTEVSGGVSPHDQAVSDAVGTADTATADTVSGTGDTGRAEAERIVGAIAREYERRAAALGIAPYDDGDAFRIVPGCCRCEATGGEHYGRHGTREELGLG